MLKRVPTEALRVGMYIETPEGSWLDFPTWRTKFMLVDEAEIQTLRDSGIKAFVIDTSKGVDALPTGRSTQPEPRAAAEAPAPTAPSAAVPQDRCSAEEEFGRSEAIISRARHAIGDIISQARLGRAVDVAVTLPVIQHISQSIERNGSALISYARMKTVDEYTYLHSIAVCALMINLGRQLLFDEDKVAELGTAGLLHDIGKVSLPHELLKKPSSLTPAEMAQVRQHPQRGVELLSRSRGVTETTLDVCLHHHERMDGRGYPHRLKGEGISLPARMAAVCDVYDAVTSRRPYKGPEEPAEALAAMFAADGQFDEQVLTAFIRSVGIYPIGSLVRMKSSRLGIVVEQNAANLTRPRVRTFYSIGHRARLPQEDIDLAQDGGDDILSREKPEKWGLNPWDQIWSQMLRTDCGQSTLAA